MEGVVEYVLWSLLLMIQNASFTWVSRARNSSSLSYHALAAICSNGVWFASQFILISVVVKDVATVAQGVFLGILYVISTVIGSVGMHWLSMNYMEKGKRRVGG